MLGLGGTVLSAVALKVRRSGGRSTQFGFTACANHKQVVERFAALDPAKCRAWLEENYAELRASELALGDLP